MKALVLKEYHKLIYQDVPNPEVGPDEVLIQVKACGICGSDVHGMDGSTGRRIPPIIMGHEASGVIAKLGRNVQKWKIGDRVTFDSTIYPLDDWFTRKGLYNLSDNRMVIGVSCVEYRRNGAFAEYVNVPQHILYKLPNKITFDQAAMVEPVAVALHAIQLTPISLNDTAIVVGAGMVGSFVIQTLKVSGCGTIIAVDLDSDKLDLASRLGADFTFNPDKINVTEKVQELTEGRGADIAFEVVGISQAIKTALDSLRKGGMLTLVGNLSSSINVSLQSVVTRQIRLQGSCAICGEFTTALSMMERGIINVDALISTAAPLREGTEWFRRLYKKEPGLIKVILNP